MAKKFDQMKSSAIKILRRLQDHGFAALFAGGCVRDMVMGRKAGDYDIVTDASPQQIMGLFKRTVPVGVQFGIVIVLMNGHKFEVAQFRNAPEAVSEQESVSLDLRLREDGRHRDFTINGMFYDPFTEKIFDYVGGQRDIERRQIRAIGSPHARFTEDYLRMLRAIRFAVSCTYTIEPDTLASIRQLASHIQGVSVERIREELLKILTSPAPAHGVRLLDETTLLSELLPEVQKMKHVRQPPTFHPEGDVFTHTLLMLEQMRRPSPELAMAVLFHDVGKPDTWIQTDRIRFPQHAPVGAKITEAICTRFKFSTKATEKIVTLVSEHQKFLDVKRMKESTLKRFLRQEHFPDLLELHRLDRLSSQRDLHLYDFCREKLRTYQAEAIHPKPLLSGKDLIRLGLSPGPEFKQILDYLEDAQLEGSITTKKQAIAFVEDFRETLS